MPAISPQMIFLFLLMNFVHIYSASLYDLRHQTITEMLEAGIPSAVIREVTGHVDPAMTRHYSHPGIAARRAAAEALMTIKSGQFEGVTSQTMSQKGLLRMLGLAKH